MYAKSQVKDLVTVSIQSQVLNVGDLHLLECHPIMAYAECVQPFKPLQPCDLGKCFDEVVSMEFQVYQSCQLCDIVPMRQQLQPELAIPADQFVCNKTATIHFCTAFFLHTIQVGGKVKL